MNTRARTPPGALAALALAACGARTDLIAPCVAPVEREPVAVVIAFSQVATTFGLRDPDGRTQAEIGVDALAQTLPALDDATVLGAVAYPSSAFHERLVEYCAPPPALDVPVAPHNVARVLTALRGVRPEPGLGGTLVQSLPVAAAALRAASSPRASRLIIAVRSADSACDTPRDAAREVAAFVAREAIPVLVVSDEFTPVPANELQPVALAGGVPQVDGPPLPPNGERQAYYDARDPATLARGLAREVLRPHYCRGHVARPPLDPDAVALRATDSGGAIARDPTRHDGWDWTDAGALEVFGPACDRVAAEQTPLVLIGPPGVCSP